MYVLHTHESMNVPCLHVHVVARIGHGVFSSTTDLSALIQSLLMSWKLVFSARLVGRQTLRICPCFSIQSYRYMHLCLPLCEYWGFKSQVCMLSERAIFPTKSSPQVLIVNFGCQYDRI